MDNLDQALNRVKDQLFALPEVKLYFGLREQISANHELQTLLKEIRIHQKAMTAAMGQIDLYQAEKTIYNGLMERYKNHPLIVNYEAIKEQVYLLLKQMQAIIE